jgi:exoribonuclease R
MIEECIILASSIAGQFVYKNLKEKTILFRHKFPGFRRMGRFKELMKKLGQPLPETNQN